MANGVRIEAHVDQRRTIHGIRDVCGNYIDSMPTYEEPESVLTLYVGNRTVRMKLVPEQLQEAHEIVQAIAFGNIESDHPDHDWQSQGSIGMRCKRCGFEVGGYLSTGWRGGVPTCNEYSMKEALE